MNLERNNLVVIIGALIAVVLQLLVAPNIALFSVQPNFLLAYVLVIAIVQPLNAGPVLPFVLGLVYDLTGVGPVGGMAFLFVLMSFVASRAFLILDNDTLFMSLAVFLIAALVTELLYGVILTFFGLSAGVGEMLLYRALPCVLYDCVVGLIAYPIMKRLLVAGLQDRGLRMPRLR